MVMPSRIDQIRHLQAEMSKLPQVELPTDHFFANGMYARRLFLPAGTALVGKAHKHEHFFMLMYGDLSVASPEGTQRVSPGAIFCSGPGAKRAGFAHTDCMVVTVHRTESQDLDAIEAEIIEPEPEALFDSSNHLKAITP